MLSGVSSRRSADRAALWRPSRLACAALAAVPVLVAAPLAHAVPLRVRAQSQIEVRVQRRDDGLLLRGRLGDDRDLPLRGESVTALVEGLATTSVATGDGGTFELLIGARDARSLAAERGAEVAWTLRFEGSASYGPAKVHGQLDLRREPSWLEVEIDPAVATLDTEVVRVSVALRAASGPVGRVPLHLAVASGPELVGDTDADGEVVFLLRPETLGRTGEFEIRARWPGDHRYAAAEARASSRLLRPTRLTLRVGREGDLQTGRYRFSGRLADDRGAVSDATIALVARPDAGVGGYRSETLATTDAAGVYLVALDARTLTGETAGMLELRAVFHPQDGLHAAAASRSARLPTPGPPGVPLAWHLSALAASLGLALLALAIRLRFWAELRALWRRWRHDRAAGPASDAPTAPDGLVVAPGRGADLRPDWLAGRVVDAHTGRGLEAVQIALVPATAGPQPLAERSRGRGGFALGPVSAGAWQLVLAADGYLPRHAAVQFPHDGTLDGATLALVSARGRVRDVFARALARFDVPLRWGVDTPAEAAQAVAPEAHESAQAVARLQELVEQVWFAPGLPTGADAEQAERLLRGLEDPETKT